MSNNQDTLRLFSPKYGSLGQPFRRTPFCVHSIRKCLTSSLDRSPNAEAWRKLYQYICIHRVCCYWLADGTSWSFSTEMCLKEMTSPWSIFKSAAQKKNQTLEIKCSESHCLTYKTSVKRWTGCWKLNFTCMEPLIQTWRPKCYIEPPFTSTNQAVKTKQNTIINRMLQDLRITIKWF